MGFIWLRGTLPRLRMDQLMGFAWKFMLPMALINMITVAVWHVMAPGAERWFPYLLLGRGLAGSRKLAKRTYRFAD